MNIAVIGDVVSIIAQRRRIERQQPQGRHAEMLEIIKFLDQPLKIADAIVVGIEERFYMNLIDDRIFIPKRVFLSGTGRLDRRRRRAGAFRTPFGRAHHAPFDQ